MPKLTLDFGDSNQYSLNLVIAENDIPRYALLFLEAGIKLSELCQDRVSTHDAQKLFEWVNTGS
jgi:hypothetical protein